MDKKLVYETLLQKISRDEPVALVTVLESRGSAPGKPGFKMLVDLSGNTVGTIGGGLLEARVIEEAVGVIKSGTYKIGTYSLTPKEAGGIGMLCGGEITVFIETVVPAEVLLVVGGGHIALPLVHMGSLLGFKVAVMDDREEFCNRERFPDASECLVGEIGSLLESYKITKNTYIVIVTRGHEHDELALEKVLGSGAAYIGMIGSRSKTEKIFKNLLEKGFEKSELDKVYTPIGLNIGAKTPEEIAVSILAEIIAVKNQAAAKTGREVCGL